MNHEVIKILQNLVRILIFVVPFGFWFHSVNSASPLPVSFSIVFGAVLGGLVFVPSMNIGNSIWRIVVLYFQNGVMSKPQPGDSGYDRKLNEYYKNVRNFRQLKWHQLARRLVRHCALVLMLFCVIPSAFLMFLYMIFDISNFSAAFPAMILAIGIIAVFAAIMGAILAFPIAGLIKLYFHEIP